jgi:hypothetical protein
MLCVGYSDSSRIGVRQAFRELAIGSSCPRPRSPNVQSSDAQTPTTTMPPPAAKLEYCELCRHHHDHGRRHRYIMKHMRNLDDALTSFCSKLSDLRRAFLHGSPSSQTPRARHWCPFCSTDIVDLDSRSAGYSSPIPCPRTPRVSV